MQIHVTPAPQRNPALPSPATVQARFAKNAMQTIAVFRNTAVCSALTNPHVRSLSILYQLNNYRLTRVRMQFRTKMARLLRK
jgi:hypothetical protein